MKAQIVTAVLLSVVLVGGATWFRFVPNSNAQPSLVTINGGSRTSDYDELLAQDFFQTSTSTTQTTDQPLTQTDLVSRQLFSDYLSLSSQNKATPENLASLAQKYATSIGNLSLSSTQISLTSVRVVIDSKENILAYGTAINTIRNKYAALVVSQKEQGDISEVGSPTFSNFMNTMGNLYESSANELRVLSVPQSLVSNHIKLVNNYLENAAAVKALSEIENDPLNAYSALNTYSKNSEEETNLLINIQLAMSMNGAFNSGI